MAPITFLHLSDIHFRSKFSTGPHDLDHDLRNEVERDAEEMAKELGGITGVLITGDVAFAGLREEYEIGGMWIRSLCGKLGCPEQNVWTVPGNHDVNRHQVREGKMLRSFRTEVRKAGIESLDDVLREWLTDANGAQLLSPLHDYIDFASPFQCDMAVDRISWRKDLTLNDGSTLRLVGLNSVLPSDESDDDGANKLVLGTAQCRMEREDGVEYLVLCHHPPNWLRDADRFNDLVNSRSHIQLFGHKHRQRLEQVNESLRVYAGALHPDRKEMNWEPTYNLLTVAIEGTDDGRTLNVRVYPRVWSDTQTKFQPTNENSEMSRNYAFALGAWERAPESHGEVPPTHVVSGMTDGEKSGVDTTVGGSVMDPTRRLVYRFLTLPYRERLDVALKLKLLSDEDASVDETELYRRFFRRARTNNRLGDLWDEVELRHKSQGVVQNPFK